MKIAVVGAGIIGLTTAHEMSSRGHTISIFDRNNSAGEGSTFANGGICSQGFALPFSGETLTGNRLTRFNRLTAQFSQVRYQSPNDLRWIWRASRPATHEEFLARVQFAQQLLQMSVGINDSLTHACMFEPEQSQGQLLLLRNEAELAGFQALREGLKTTDQPVQVLDSQAILRAEQALQVPNDNYCGLHLPADRVMNCRQYALFLKQQLTQTGARFLFHSDVTRIAPGTNPTLELADGSSHTFDQVIVCTGGTQKANPFKIAALQSVAEIGAYALSVPIREPLNAPKSCVQDTRTGITISRLGKRLRVCGGAELNRPRDSKIDEKVVAKLFQTLDRLFPGAANYAAGTQVWRGTFGITPDRLPMIGSTGEAGVWINAGHGNSGWGFASGSARLLCEQIEGLPTSLDASFVDPQRFQR
jgi:D-amino-acid dehydrogenase